MISQHRAKRKSTGGKYQAARKKKLYEKADNATLTKVGEKSKSRISRGRGANTKIKVLTAESANVLKGKSIQKTKIKAVLENTANRNYVRRNILNKGAIIDTELGKAKVTSRPAQDGVVNAVLLEK